jgi:hypothetical protein
LGMHLTQKDRDTFHDRNEIAQVKARLGTGRKILRQIPVWEDRAKTMKEDAERFWSLDDEAKIAQLKADDLGVPLESLRTPEGWMLDWGDLQVYVPPQER